MSMLQLFSTSVTGIWGLVALRLADDLILPFNYLSYATELQVEYFIILICKVGVLDFEM